MIDITVNDGGATGIGLFVIFLIIIKVLASSFVIYMLINLAVESAVGHPERALLVRVFSSECSSEEEEKPEEKKVP